MQTSAPPPLSLPVGMRHAAVHLHLVAFDDCRDPALLDGYRALLAPEELDRQRALASDDLRHRDLVTRALVRTVLSLHAPVAPRDWRFAANASGKPAVHARHGDAARLAFNLSRGADAVILALTAAGGRDLGVDMASARDDAGLPPSERLFSPRELDALAALPPAARGARMRASWTLKESWFKARGTGISTAPRHVAFDLETPGGVAASLDPTLDERPGRWAFRQFVLALDGREMAVALCATRTAQALELALWRDVPLRSRRPLAAPAIAREAADR